MNTNDGSFGAGYCKIKTARQKKRLQKKDFEKRLIQLHRLRKKLSAQERELPMVPLETPYQKGWKRSYILREDVARSRYAAFYQTLLDKINTIVYHHDKRFKRSKKKKRKRIDVDIPQTLLEFNEYDWKSPRNKLTEAERILFYPKVVTCPYSKRLVTRYVFSEAWRYVLRIRPHMITHVKMIDEALEREIQRLDNHIENHNLGHRISKLVDGSCYSAWRHRNNKLRYREEFFKQPMYKILEAYVDEEIKDNCHEQFKN